LIDASKNGGFVAHLCAMGTLLFVLSFALLAVQASATLPISDVSSSKVTTAAIQKMSGRKMGELKAQAVNRMAKKHMLAEQGDDAKEVVGFGGMHYKRTKEEEEQAKQGPSFTDIWQIREMFARCFGYAFLVGITIIILACCFNLRGCYIYDKFIDKEKPNLNEEEETILPGDSSRN